MNMYNQTHNVHSLLDTPLRISNTQSEVVEKKLYQIGKNPIVQRRAKDQKRMTIEGAFINRNTYQYQ